MQLPPPPVPAPRGDQRDVVAWVAEHLGDLTLEGPAAVRPGGHRGGQAAADAALASLDVGGYAARRNEVHPRERRGASGISPWIRHGLLTLREVWDRVEDAPSRDRRTYRDELLWQEYARHLYARVGVASGRALRYEQPRPAGGAARTWGEPWPREMRCMDATLGELHEDGWLVNQTRMWLASQWAVRAGAHWRGGEDAFFTHLLDGSRAANRLGWQWTVATGSAKPYGFSRWQVEKRAPGLCGSCALSEDCPVQAWPDAVRGPEVDHGPDLGHGEIPAGPEAVQVHEQVADRAVGEPGATTEVWLTAESLGRADPALAADPDRPAVFVFDEALLGRLRLSGKRLVFLAECLGDLAAERDLDVRRGDVVEELAGRHLAATWTPVPGWQRRAAQLAPAEVHPWPWLVRPRPAPVRSFSAWRKALRA